MAAGGNLQDEDVKPSCKSVCFRCLGFISLIKVKHSGIWNLGKNEYTPDLAIIVSALVTLILLSHGISYVSTFG
jgi:hypothetical protein